MAGQSLVEPDINWGKSLIQQLDRDKFAVTSALWIFSSDRNDWSLWIASPLAKKKGPRHAYEVLYKSLGKVSPGRTTTFAITIVDEDHPLLKKLHSVIRTGKSDISEIRFRNNVVDGALIDDAVIYRLS